MRLGAALLVVALALPSLAAAQPAQQPAPVDATKIPVSLDRIKRELREAEARAQEPGTLNLSFHVDVFGEAPKIDFFDGFRLDLGPVPYGGPTHREVIDFLTPQEFSSSASGASFAIFSKLAVWGAKKVYARIKKERCEREFEEYRALVMQGVAVAAPRCVQ